jgi:plasmid stabilization system protein ParE
VSYRVIVTPTANAEALTAFDWYAEQSPGAARRWYKGLSQAIASLAEGPERCPVSEDDSEVLGREVRVKLYGRRRGVYRILFALRGEEVHILRIRHAARGPLES